MSGRECRNKYRQGHQRKGPGLRIQQREHDTIDIRGNFDVAAVGAVNNAVSRAQPGQELLGVSRAGNFGVGAAHAGNGVRIAAGDGNLSKPLGEPLRLVVGPLPHLPIARLKCGNVGHEPMEIVLVARPCQAGKNVVHAAKELAFREIHHQ